MSRPLNNRKEKNREKKLGYLALADVECSGGFVSLCPFCLFAEQEGDWCDASLECNHPLPVLSEREDWGPWREGEDCWGFRPRMSVEVAADLVGIWLQGKPVDSRTIPMLQGGKGWREEEGTTEW